MTPPTKSDGTGTASDVFKDTAATARIAALTSTTPWPSFPTRNIQDLYSEKTPMHDSVFGTTSGGGQGPGAT